MIRGYDTDSLGKGPKQYITNEVQDFYIDFVSRDPIIIPADTLVGYNSEVEVLLTGITYSHFDGVKKYLIKKTSKNRIELRFLKDNERMVLVRAGTE